MANGYEDIDRLVAQQRAGYDEAMRQQNDIVNQQTQMQVDSLARQKEQIDKEATAQNKALYQDYKKNINPFGVQAENLAGQGLANSGYAETTLSRMYNTYQNNITSTLNNARDLKADVDFQINQARQTGNITLAQNALELYKQKMQLLTEEYDLRNNREQYLYQKEQDALAQANWQKEFDYNKSVADRNYNYQIARDQVADSQWNQQFSYQKSRDKVSDSQWNKQFSYQQKRDKVSDSQWQKEYELSKKARASSSRSGTSSRSTGSKKQNKNGNNGLVPVYTGESTKSSVPKKKDGSEYTPKEIIANIKNVQGANVTNPIADGISGKRFKSVDALLNYYGYAGVNN